MTPIKDNSEETGSITPTTIISSDKSLNSFKNNNNIILDEKINKKRANYLLDNLTFDDYFASVDIYDKNEAKKNYEKIIKYLKYKITSSLNSSKYTYCKNRNDGRLYGENTLQNVSKEIRGFICDSISTDIDIDNAHPVILLQLCKKYNIISPCLDYYVNNRNKCLNEIMEDDNCNRIQAKKKILISTNDFKKIKSKNSFFNKYDTEVKEIQNKFLDIDDYNYLKEFAKKDVNFKGSYINHILCVNENIILSAIRDYCDLNNIQIQALMFDGLMVYGDYKETSLSLIENHIKENTIFKKIKLSIKPHEYEYLIPKDYKCQVKLSYEEMREIFEKENFKIGCKFYNFKDNRLSVYNRKDFQTKHEELTYFTTKKVDFIKDWFKDEKKRRYDYTDAFPKDGLCPDNVYNTWVKFPVQLMDTQPDCEKNIKALNWFLNHIKVLVNYNGEHYKFVKKWLAQMFQYPENKTIELIFISEEGAGKGTFLNFLRTIMGGGVRCWESTSPEDEIFGKYNDNMADAFLVCFNESNKSNFYNSNEKKKALITEPMITIKPKGHTNYVMRSCHRFILFSNNCDPNQKNKRRDFTMRCSDDKIDNELYFKEGNDYANDLNCCKYIYDYFMNLKNVKSTIVKNDIPKGTYDELLKEMQTDVINDFLKDKVYELREKDEKVYTNDELYQQFYYWCKENNNNYNIGKIAFCMKIHNKKEKLNGIANEIKWFQKKTTRVWIFNIKEMAKSLNMDLTKEDEFECE
tara:strand:- start:40 stop:2283 length:2244 start_codon:yes stop_codon:yes gene_type:complete